MWSFRDAGTSKFNIITCIARVGSGGLTGLCHPPLENQEELFKSRF